jgi:hypothetical protein
MSVGLAICKSFVEAHHGRVWVDERAGGGSVFHFAVPMHDREEQARLGPGDRPRKKEPRYVIDDELAIRSILRVS